MPVAIDRRPWPALLLRQSLPYLALLLLALLAWWALEQAPPQGLSVSGWRAIIVFALCLILWVTQLLPLAVTSLLGLALLPLLGALTASEAYSLFGNPAVFFILGAFILAAGVMKTGLSEHIALGLLRYVGTSPRRLLAGMLLFPAMMAAFMPEHAVAAIFLPIVLEIIHGLGLPRDHRYAVSLLLAMAWGAIIGGVATLLGGARGPLAIGILQEITGRSLTFADWTLAAAPIVIAMLTVALGILLYGVRGTDIGVAAAGERLRQRQLELGRLPARGKWMSVIMLATVSAWVLMGHAYGLASIALAAVVIMFACRLITWRDVEEYVNWGVVLMYGGAIAVGKALSDTGAAAWLASGVLPADVPPLALLAVLAAITLLLTETVSNAAAVAILLPIAVPLGIEAGVDAVTVALAVAIVAGFAFMLPMGTPANALIYSTGYLRLRYMLKRGIILSASSWLLFMATAAWVWPHLGWGW